MNKTNNNSTYLKSINWKILGIDENATEKEIKDAYARLAEMFRPDKIKETKGRESNQTEQQKWNEILDNYYEALKEVNKKKSADELNKDKQKNENNVNDTNRKKKTLGETLERESLYHEKIIEPFLQIRMNREKKDGHWTRTADITDYYLSKRDLGGRPLDLNERTRQLARNIYPLTGCGCRNDESQFNNGDARYNTGYFWVAGHHFSECLKTNSEIEEFAQKLIKNYTEILEETDRVALADEESVRAVDEMRKSRSCIGCHLENKDTNTNNKQSALTFNEEREEINNAQTNQNSAENEKPSTITDQEEINNAQTNQNSAENNVISSDKKVDNHLSEKNKKKLAAKNKQSQKSLENNNQKTNHLISIGLPIGIIFVLVVSSVFWMVKRKRFKKEKN